MSLNIWVKKRNIAIGICVILLEKTNFNAWTHFSTEPDIYIYQGQIQGGALGARAPLTTKNEAPAPKFYKTEAPQWQF